MVLCNLHLFGATQLIIIIIIKTFLTRMGTWQLSICRKDLKTQNEYKKNNYMKKFPTHYKTTI